VEAVLSGMADGKTLQETIKEVARARGEVIRPGSVRMWITLDEAWYLRYQKTKALLGQALAEEAIVVARESTSSTTAMDRVLIDTLKWAASKANPLEYGEKQTVEHQGTQTLQVKVVEDEAPVRNEKALKNVMVAATVTSTLAVGAGVAGGDWSDGGSR
jgi:hypothetical protein